MNSQKLTVNRETVIKITAVVAIAALMFSLILVFNGMIGYAADDYLYFFKYTGHVVKRHAGTPDGNKGYFYGHGDALQDLQWQNTGAFSPAAVYSVR